MVLEAHADGVKKRRFHMKLKSNLLVATATVAETLVGTLPQMPLIVLKSELLVIRLLV